MTQLCYDEKKEGGAEMERELNCLRCGERMRYARREKIQLGETGWLSGDWGNLMAGAMEVDIYSCPKCRKLEFFQADGQQEEGLPQKQCPKCGKRHDFDYPKCPFCKYDYNA